jgi:hypothetical protein
MLDFPGLDSLRKVAGEYTQKSIRIHMKHCVGDYTSYSDEDSPDIRPKQTIVKDMGVNPELNPSLVIAEYQFNRVNEPLELLKIEAQKIRELAMSKNQLMTALVAIDKEARLIETQVKIAAELRAQEMHNEVMQKREWARTQKYIWDFMTEHGLYKEFWNGLARSALLAAGRPDYYLGQLGFEPYDWQIETLDRSSNRVLLLAPRQSGKSIVVAGLAVHTAKIQPGSLIVIIAPKLNQAMETARKVKDFIALDRELIVKRSNDSLVELDTGSRILCLAATENAPRGYSAPDLIILDEAARTPDEVYAATRPQLTTNPDAKLVILSTPFGRSGFFWRAWAEEKYWKKIRVETGFVIQKNESGIMKIVPDTSNFDEKKKYWAEKGVQFFLSPHHRQSWLQEELDTVGDWWYSQEYGIQFKESIENLFDFHDIRAAFASDDDLLPALQGYHRGDGQYSSDMEALQV